ncbi:MAG: serine/threonine protein kinase [Deltaproteobacteria bacterium]|nr:serine/threonine protein kinase [Deltaproteobacteria bacterium]
MTVRLERGVGARTCPQCGQSFEAGTEFCPRDGSALMDHSRPSAGETDTMVGRVLEGKYRIDSVLGKGGMGVVYTATHAKLGKRMALKILRSEMSQDADLVSRFTQEARAASAIGSEHITDVTDFGDLPDGSTYFVMEYLEGVPLSGAMKKTGPIDPAKAVHIMAQICKALGAAHAGGIVHRDLKPDNVFLIRRGDRDDFVKILDFGIAKVGGAVGPRTRSGMIFGTPHYMSPEQAAGNLVDPRADIYAAGVILFQMLTGQVPFDADSFMGILTKHMFEDAPRMDSVRPDEARPLELEAIVSKAMAKRPEDRFQTMEEFRRALLTAVPGAASALGTSPPIPLRIAGGARPSDDAGTSNGDTVPSGIIVRPARRVGLFVAIGMGVAALAVGVVILANRPTAAPVLPPPAPVPALPPRVAPLQPPTTELPAPPVRSVKVRIESSPTDAEVFEAAETAIGRTPLEIDRPSGTARTLTLRASDHDPMQIQVSPDSEDTVSVTLQRSLRPVVRRPRPTGGSGELHDPFGD